MKRVTDVPYSPDFGPVDPDHQIPRLDPHLARQLGFGVEDAPVVDERALRERHVPLRRRPGRPYQGPSESWRAFRFVRGQRNLYCAKFGVKRVPATETDKFIEYALLLYPKASETRLREHISKHSQKWLPY